MGGPRQIIVEYPGDDGRGPVHLVNKIPEWNAGKGVYQMRFHGRVTCSSVKNMSLVPDVLNNEGHPYTIQFGKTDDNSYSLDFRGLSPVRAFALALGSFGTSFIEKI